MDVKVGSGAFMPTPEASRELAETIAEVASRAGTPTTALLTDMSQPLAPCAGNAWKCARHWPCSPASTVTDACSR